MSDAPPPSSSSPPPQPNPQPAAPPATQPAAPPATQPTAPPANSPRPLPRTPVDPAKLMDVATLRQFAGAPETIALLEHAVELAMRQNRRLEHVLILGPNDSGKQIAARALARDYAQPTMELDSAWIRSARQLARTLRPLDDRDTLLLRRVDQLRPTAVRLLISLLGMRTLRRDPETTTQLADITVIATATESALRGAAAHRPLARCFPLTVSLPAPTIATRTLAALRALAAMGVSLTPALRQEAEHQVAHTTSQSLTRGASPALIARAIATRVT